MAPSSASAATTRARSASRSANGPTPAKRSATAFAAPAWASTSRARVASPSSVACRNAPGGNATVQRPIFTVGAARCATSSPWRVMRARRWVSATPRERERHLRVERARTPDVHVDAGIGRGRLDVERLAGRAQRFGHRPGGLDDSGKAGREDRAAVDRHDAMGLARGKADLQHVMGGAAGMQHDAAASRAMGVDEVVDLRRDAGLAQRIDHEIALPGAIARGLPMLERAAAAHAEMRTDRRDALGACGLDPQQMAAIGMPGPRLGLDDLARQRVGHVDRPRLRQRDAVALAADVVDGQAVNQGGRR